MIEIAIFFLLLFPLIRLVKMFLIRGRPVSIARRRGQPQVRLMAILGSGGHTTEMLRIVKVLDDEFTPICFIVADTDKHSAKMTHEMIKRPFNIKIIPRAREVKQSWTSTIFSTMKAFFAAIPIIYDVRPDLILVNGPGTAIPLIIASFILQLTTNHDVKLGKKNEIK